MRGEGQGRAAQKLKIGEDSQEQLGARLRVAAVTRPQRGGSAEVRKREIEKVYR